MLRHLSTENKQTLKEAFNRHQLNSMQHNILKSLVVLHKLVIWGLFSQDIYYAITLYTLFSPIKCVGVFSESKLCNSPLAMKH